NHNRGHAHGSRAGIIFRIDPMLRHSLESTGAVLKFYVLKLVNRRHHVQFAALRRLSGLKIVNELPCIRLGIKLLNGSHELARTIADFHVIFRAYDLAAGASGGHNGGSVLGRMRNDWNAVTILAKPADGESEKNEGCRRSHNSERIAGPGHDVFALRRAH